MDCIIAVFYLHWNVCVQDIYGIIDINENIISYENHKVSYNIQEVLDDCKKYEFPDLSNYEKKLTSAK